MTAVTEAVQYLLERATDYAANRAYELKLEDGRPAEKLAAIQRIMGAPNMLTGKPHSASSAEAIVETDLAYAAYRARQRDAVVDVILSRAQYEAAVFQCRAASAAPVLAEVL